jgi:hypothetical protein
MWWKVLVGTEPCTASAAAFLAFAVSCAVRVDEQAADLTACNPRAKVADGHLRDVR